MPADVTLACVGKPSAGKSSFLNAVTDASAKVGTAGAPTRRAARPSATSTTHAVPIRCCRRAACPPCLPAGNYPFTTIEPNHGVTFYPVRQGVGGGSCREGPP